MERHGTTLRIVPGSGHAPHCDDPTHDPSTGCVSALDTTEGVTTWTDGVEAVIDGHGPLRFTDAALALLERRIAALRRMIS